MDLGLKGKRALVMASSAGIGKGIAGTLVKEGASVVICARNLEKLKDVAKEINAKAAIQCDLYQPGAATALIQQTNEQLGGVDILVINTGGPPKGTLEDLSQDDWKKGFQGLWLSTTDAIKEVLPNMKKQKWGRILLITSVAAKEPIAKLSLSSAIRAGLLGFTNTLSKEVAAYGITVNTVLPGYTKTERIAELGVPDKKLASDIPAGRLATPQEIGALSAFLVSDQAAYITGQAIACDGGYLRGI